MGKKAKRGSPESSWLAARRCLALINRLQQGVATKQELLATIYRAEDPIATPSALNGRFENDKIRLWENLQIHVRYDKVVKGYRLVEWERPLLNLSDTQIETLAFLADTFQPDSPHASKVHQLIDQLVSWLPEERQRLFKRGSGQLPTADLRQRDSEEIAPDVWEKVLEGWQAKQELQFDYHASQHDDGLPRQHRIQPWELYFTERRHWHLRGYCLFNDGPNGPWHPNDYINYRVSRIVPTTVEILSRKLPGVRPHGRPREVVFELAPTVTRFGVSERRELIAPPKLTELDEGWVRVEGKTYDVFALARNLLYYGRNCQVLGGPELLREMRELVKGLMEMYE
ncbi:MAG: WYL domain-containing protein [Anaerolineales bacterium]|nr:WYL domain-containing protein [Anaerolineales bacterium]